MKNKKIIFLLAPSEGKKSGGNFKCEKLSFDFKKPLSISINASEKDLKCSGNRFIEGIELNKNLEKSEFIETINRYSGVMYNAIDYNGMNEIGKNNFENNFLIFSGMYGILNPLDIIGNYKLPIETKGLYEFWGENVALEIKKINPDYVVNLLPGSYAKLIGIGKSNKLQEIKNLYIGKNTKLININFLTKKKCEIVKLSHGVKKYRGEWIKNICENSFYHYEDFGGKVVKNGNEINVNIIVKN